MDHIQNFLSDTAFKVYFEETEGDRPEAVILPISNGVKVCFILALTWFGTLENAKEVGGQCAIDRSSADDADLYFAVCDAPRKKIQFCVIDPHDLTIADSSTYDLTTRSEDALTTLRTHIRSNESVLT
jgi:hypothetical protein